MVNSESYFVRMCITKNHNNYLSSPTINHLKCIIEADYQSVEYCQTQYY